MVALCYEFSPWTTISAPEVHSNLSLTSSANHYPGSQPKTGHQDRIEIADLDNSKRGRVLNATSRGAEFIPPENDHKTIAGAGK
ncbi:hypothetical protein DY000_02008542 [Brassica cretica]|uniref:Uncharacterized protein n=1 Tax=Brassica cretica TaxID=69181 RepID=A0ABQ7BVD9_BRACR|nr:hypothetical protein DY000_02008542 [Brassica cretica]